MTKLEEIESSLLNCMEPEIDETIYAGGLMRDDVLAALARAAVKAMMTPSKGMIKAAESLDDPGSLIFHEPFVAISHGEAWTVMCRAILDEKPS